MVAEKAIELQGVTYKIDGTTILNQIDGSFYKGRITSLVGPSGAGKTSLFRLCNGMRTATEGTIQYNGKLLSSYVPTELRKKVGIVLQQATMINGTVRENLVLPLTLANEQLKDDAVKQSLEEVGLAASTMTKQAKELSGGQKQKLSIARTLLNQPDVLLLDEITSSLDRVSVREIEHLIEQIHERYGTTIVWITHQIEQAKRLSHDSWVMMDGQLVEHGTTQILDHPQDPRVIEFLKEER
ncbi:phosphate ABC transporter ATP-binding protein [Shouchella sp. JSM 1781072]|uniref:ABC transporter ATP-binding protein n=1 Tax=Bacillaceae TaxID=186817 RepID=UPI00278C48D2|nr:phosphate ABC transporter ATP-binding protein [Bacillus sp. Marseille-P3800]